MTVSRLKYSLLAIWLMLALSGCAAVHRMMASDIELLKERANLRWQALINKEWETAYSFELPAYRLTHDVNQYRAKFGSKVQWLAIEIVSAEVAKEAVLADVNLKLRYQFAMPGTDIIESDKLVHERWMKQEGEWWMVSSQ